MKRRRHEETDWTLSTRCIDSQRLILWAKKVSPDAPPEPPASPPTVTIVPATPSSAPDFDDEEPTRPSERVLRARSRES